MSIILLVTVVVAAGLIVLSGLWVAVALFDAVWRGDRPASSPDVPDKNVE